MMCPNITHDTSGGGVLEDFKNDFILVGAGESNHFLSDGVPDTYETVLFEDFECSAKFFTKSHFNLLLSCQESRRLRSDIRKGWTNLRIVYFRVNMDTFFPPSR